MPGLAGHGDSALQARSQGIESCRLGRMKHGRRANKARRQCVVPLRLGAQLVAGGGTEPLRKQGQPLGVAPNAVGGPHQPQRGTIEALALCVERLAHAPGHRASEGGQPVDTCVAGSASVTSVS